MPTTINPSDQTITQFAVQIGATNNTLASIALGTATQVLTSNGPGVAPTFQAAGGGGVGGTQAFNVYLSASTGNVTGDSTTVTVPYDTVLFDNGSNFSTGNNWYVVPITGQYQFSANLIFGNSAGTNTGTFLELFVGSQVYFLNYNGPYNVALNNGTANGSITVPCNAGDHVFVQTAVNGNATKNVFLIGSNQGFTSFSGFRVA
jgi:hypothetical protein